MHRLVVWLLALAALVAAGCSGGEPSGASRGDATVVATAEFGQVGLLNVPVDSGASLMRATRDATEVDTAFGGDFVEEMLGRRSDAGARTDWFWFVNGMLGATSASEYTLRPGDVGWWDYRSWAGQMDVFAVVGAWPEPFVHGVAGRPPVVSADPPLAAALRAAGARVATGPSGWRVRVGSDAELRRRDPVWARAMRDPTRAGAPGAVEGGRVTVLGQGGAGREAVPGARAVAVAVRTGDEPADGMLLAVAGLDGAAAQAAARAIAARPALLRLRYAVAFDG
ncbi:MAG: DUF4430 domain-containing protein, partial [Actinomycetota bacterium]